MDIDMLIGKFARIGVRAKIADHRVDRWGRVFSPKFRIDIDRDRQGEYFDMLANPHLINDVAVTDVRRDMRHLLLQVDHRAKNVGRQKFLCGHDERHWFVAAVPETAAASNVITAMQALKPPQVRAAEARVGLKAREGRRRKNKAFVRQGEWFFIPRLDARVDARLILHHEPISRGVGSKPHVVEQLVRTGGDTVYVSREHPNGLSERSYRRFVQDHPDKAKGLQFTVMRRNPDVLVRGKVRHPDHKTIVLNGWHQVIMNTEHESQAMSHMAFLD